MTANVKVYRWTKESNLLRKPLPFSWHWFKLLAV